MLNKQGAQLDTGDPFPPMRLTTTTGERVDLPTDFAGSWGLVLFYRGDW